MFLLVLIPVVFLVRLIFVWLGGDDRPRTLLLDSGLDVGFEPWLLGGGFGRRFGARRVDFGLALAGGRGGAGVVQVGFDFDDGRFEVLVVRKKDFGGRTALLFAVGGRRGEGHR